jgi:NAD(P)-dependent dehydrogenase (short-subunit alcohol dehydrogenase family)
MSKIALVIGASRGIGKALIETLSAKGIDTTGCARSLTHSDSGNLHLRHLDLSAPDLKSNLEQIIHDLPHIDYLVNNAGAIAVKPFMEMTREDMLSVYQVNVFAVMEVIQTCLSKMKKGSHIVNISSMGGFQGTMKFPGLSVYSPSKAAVVALTELLAEELKDTGVSINCLCLGAVQTEMMEEAFPGYIAPHTAPEMAEFIANFTTTSASYMHGRIIPVSTSTP